MICPTLILQGKMWGLESLIVCLAHLFFISEFLIIKKSINTLLEVRFKWNANDSFALTIKNSSLLIEVNGR